MDSVVSFAMRIKLAIKKFVGKNEVFIVPVLKFLLTLTALLRISSKVGFMPRLTGKPIVLVIALAGSFLPMNLTLVILALIILAHMYSLSMECALIVLVLFTLLFILYFRFASEDSTAAVLTPLSFAFKVPYIMPVAMGLKGTVTSMVSVGSSVVVYQTLHFISENSESLAGGEANMLGQFKIIVDAMLKNKPMIVYAVSFAITVLIVYIIRRLAVKYAWLIAIGSGEVILFLTVIVLNAKLAAGISIGGLFLGVIVSTIANLILCYFCFDLNYSKAEKVQYEDDEYYYYVKAIPKNEYLEKPGKKKKKTSRPAPAKSYYSRESVNHETRIQEKEKKPVRETKTATITRKPITRKTDTYEGVTHVRPMNSDEAAAALRHRNAPDKNDN